MFGIFPEDKPIDVDGEIVLPASIVIDEFKEVMHISLTYWKISDYKESWLRSIKEGLENKNHAALAVSMYEPDMTNFIFVWVIYFYDHDVRLQNKVLFLDEYPDFAIDKINNFIEPHITHNEDGMKISEWNTDINSILDFHNSLEADMNPGH